LLKFLTKNVFNIVKLILVIIYYLAGNWKIILIDDFIGYSTV
jgi:hypothetical protein